MSSRAFLRPWLALRARAKRAAALEGRLSGLRRPGPWFVCALVLGAALRVYLVVETEGTYDVVIWQTHASWTRLRGLVGYYEHMQVFNQPPFIAQVMAGIWTFSELSDLPFKVLLRAPTALFDLGTAFLLVRAFRRERFRWLVCAAYWLHPLALIFSAYHGNTDSLVAFAMLLAVVLAGEGRVLAAAAVLGVGTWIKLPVTLAFPALLFATAGSRRRLLFTAIFLAVGISTYLPILVEAPGLLVERVFAYAGSSIETRGGVPIWGAWNLFGLPRALETGSLLRALADFHARHNSLICWAGVLAYAWLRRGATGTRELGTSVCGSLAIFYALTTNLAFQYLAWSLPFWFFPGPTFFLAASLVVGTYVYAVYAFVCGSPLLLGKWNFLGRPRWPTLLVGLRDASVLVFLAASAGFLTAAAKREAHRRRVTDSLR